MLKGLLLMEKKRLQLQAKVMKEKNLTGKCKHKVKAVNQPPPASVKVKRQM